MLCQAMSQQSDQREQTQQGRCSPCNGQVRPLALGFKSQMRPSLLKSDFDIPAHNVPGQDLQGRRRLVCREKGFRFEFVQGITHQHPAQWQRVIAWRVPQSRTAGYLDDAPLTTVPINLALGPLGRRVVQDFLQRRLTFTFLRFRTTPAFGLWTWRVMQYWPWLFWEIVKANWAVSKAVLKPRMNISPTVVHVPSGQKSELGDVIYGNSITLTPGTVTIQLENGELTVHALNRESAEALLTGDMGKRVFGIESRGETGSDETTGSPRP